MKQILIIFLTGFISMYNLTNIFIDIIFLCIFLLLLIFILVLYRAISIKKYYHKYSQDDSLKDVIAEPKFILPQQINPIVSEYKSYFKIYKLDKNYTPKSFLNNHQDNTTVFIRMEKNNDSNKNSH